MLVVDESMIQWAAECGAHLTYLPRKPTPLGIGIKCMVDHTSGIMLCAGLLEGKGIDNKKEFVAEYGVATATTLRLVAPYFGSARVVIADSWFGSYKCAVALRQKGLFSIMNIKTGHKKFPRDKIKEALQQRGDQKHYRV